MPDRLSSRLVIRRDRLAAIIMMMRAIMEMEIAIITFIIAFCILYSPQNK